MGRTKRIAVNPVTYCYINSGRNGSGHGKYLRTVMEELKNGRISSSKQLVFWYPINTRNISIRPNSYLYGCGCRGGIVRFYFSTTQLTARQELLSQSTNSSPCTDHKF